MNLLEPESDKLGAAHDYARRGWRVFRCNFMVDGHCSCSKDECTSPGKHPMLAAWPQFASTLPDEIEAWWEQEPRANIGIAMGPKTGAWVLDLDGADGIATLEALVAEHGPIPPTPTVATGGGGRHLYFAYPPDRRIGIQGSDFHPSIHVRGDGGYVIAPPSNHRSGNLYRWEVSPDDVPLADAPEWLLDFVEGQGSRTDDTIDDGFAELTGGYDLRSHPGVSEGQRHTMALKLIGAHLGRGEKPIEVCQLARKWADRCDPPMDHAELERIVHDLSDKDAKKVEKSVQKVMPWPVMDKAALYGLAGDIVQALEPQTEADPAAILAQLLACFGNIAGRNAFQMADGQRHYANLFVAVVGESSKARKGTSAARVLSLFDDFTDDWAQTRVMGGLSTGEGLIEKIRDPNPRAKSPDPGVEDKRLQIFESELASVLSVMNRDGNTLSPVLRNAWDGKKLGTMTRNAPLIALKSHVSIIAHIVREELRKKLTNVDSFNGFANRWLWICARRSKLLPHGGEEVDLGLLKSRLWSAIQFANSMGKMERDAAAKEDWAKLYMIMAGTVAGGIMGSILARAEAQVLRLSMIYALLDSSPAIRVEHLRAAYALWRYAEDSARHIFGEATGDAFTEKVKAIIVEHGPITQTKIHKLLGNHATKETLGEALRTLKSQGLIKSETMDSTGGRTATLRSTL